MLFHVYWKGEISEKLALMMKSFIFTQPLYCSKLYVWIDNYKEDLENKNLKLLKNFIPKYIELKAWNNEEQLKSIDLFKGWEEKLGNQTIVEFSDLARF